MPTLTCKTELRHLSQLERAEIERLLNESDSWRDLIAIIPKELDSLQDDATGHSVDRTQLLINSDRSQVLEKQRINASPSKALLDYWSTYGIRRPTIEHLIYYAAKCKLYRLVDHIVVSLLKSRSIDEYAPKTRSLLIDKLEFEQRGAGEASGQTNESDRQALTAPNAQLSIDGIRELNFDLIKKYTNNFNDAKLKDGGNKVGEGGFGVVYLAKIPKSELSESLDCELDHTGTCYLIAVKVVSNEFQDQYKTELKNLAQYKHANLLNLIGLTGHLNTWCILFEYMINNSLQDCLLASNVKPIGHEQRIKITGQIIDAICYLHTSKETPLIHRDIKSSNILLDRNLNAKLCDFGLARSGSLTSKTMSTFNIIGTSVYMSPEAFKGQISVKIDTFSFGIVLLELLTGLPPAIDEQGEESIDILSYMNENIFGELEEAEDDYDQSEYERTIVGHLDRKAGNWNLKIAIQLFDLARQATNYHKIKRPTMVKVKELFEKIIKIPD